MPVDSDEAIQAIHRTLQNAHEETVYELGKSFYRNHVEFIAVAKEAERFESDLTAMRAMISQLKAFSVQITGEREVTGKRRIRITSFLSLICSASYPATKC